MSNDTEPTPIAPDPVLVAFEPCEGWWAVYFVPANDRHGEQFRREPIAGWGIHVENGQHYVIGMVADAAVLVPAGEEDKFVHLYRSGSSYCDCYDPDGDRHDWSWCPECGAEIFGRAK